MSRPFPFRSRMLVLSTVLASALAAGCGGGGDGAGEGGRGGSNAPTGITTANARAVASQAYVAVDLLAGPVEVVTGIVLSSAAPAEVSSAAPVASRWARSALATGAAIGVAAKAVATETRACAAGGSVTRVADDADGDGALLSARDSLTVRFDQCAADGTVTTGTMRESGFALTTRPDGQGREGRSTLTLDGLAVTTGGLTETGTGQFEIVMAWQSKPESLAATVTGDSFRIVGDNGSVELTGFRYHQVLDAVGFQFTVDSTVHSPFGTLRLSTPTAFGGDGGCDRPVRGSLDVVGADGSRLALTALSCTTVRLDVDANGDGQFESTETLGWNEIDPSAG